jgi:hypothetical protein
VRQARVGNNEQVGRAVRAREDLKGTKVVPMAESSEKPTASGAQRRQVGRKREAARQHCSTRLRRHPRGRGTPGRTMILGSGESDPLPCDQEWWNGTLAGFDLGASIRPDGDAEPRCRSRSWPSCISWPDGCSHRHGPRSRRPAPGKSGRIARPDLLPLGYDPDRRGHLACCCYPPRRCQCHRQAP